MNFITNNYDSSESDSDEIIPPTIETLDNVSKIVPPKPINFFAEDSDNDEEILEETIDADKKLPSLLNPFRLTDSLEMKHDSVFQIQFIEDEKKASNALEKHVKMTANQEAITEINGKKICWNFRRGRCRFGHNCTFAHDSDIQLMEREKFEKEQAEKKLAEAMVITSDKKKEKNEDEEEERIDKRLGKKRGRPGLSQNLVPGKKGTSANRISIARSRGREPLPTCCSCP